MWKQVCGSPARGKKVLVAQSCLTPCDPTDCSPLGSSVHRILQARILEWVAVSYSSGSSWPRDRTRVSRIAFGFFTIWATMQEGTALNPRWAHPIGLSYNSWPSGWVVGKVPASLGSNSRSMNCVISRQILYPLCALPSPPTQICDRISHHWSPEFCSQHPDIKWWFCLLNA